MTRPFVYFRVPVSFFGTGVYLDPGLANGRQKPERGGAVDLDKRLKEVKYTPIDLKLKHSGTRIAYWCRWIRSARPTFYSLWACYLGKRELANPAKMIEKFRKLRAYYNDGVGVFFYTQGEGGGYIPFRLPELREFLVDDVIEEVCATLNQS